MGASSTSVRLPDFSTATLGEKKANVNSIFAKLFPESRTALGYIFDDAQADYRRPHRRRFDSSFQSRANHFLGNAGLLRPRESSCNVSVQLFFPGLVPLFQRGPLRDSHCFWNFLRPQLGAYCRT